jgi:quaternary ammonium compound-resistance protein SugE
MAWLILFIAGLLEVVWAIGLKYTQGFTKLLPSVITIFAIIGSLALLSYSLKTIPIGNAYAIWTGIGAVGVAIVGIFWFNESSDIKRILCIALIIIGILGLKLLDVNENAAN